MQTPSGLCLFAATCLVSAPFLAFAEEGQDGPSEYGLRFTPEMARGLAREFVHHEVIRRYEVDSSKEDEMTELVARRIMEAMHEIDTPQTQETAERMAGNFFRLIAESQRLHRKHMPPELAEALARDLLPLMPNVRELVRNVGQDVRPMLPMKQQLRLAADLMAVKTAMDGFEATMQRWSRGDVAPGEDPFEFDDRDEPRLGPEGVSEQLKRAREASVRQDPMTALKSHWERYINSARETYGFDESQMATARSILREAETRAAAVVNREEYQAQRNSVRMWHWFWESLGREYRSEGPVKYLLLRRVVQLHEPIANITEELEQRVDRIAREEQRRAAEERMHARLAELGFDASVLDADAGVARQK
jgi:hypothetical protein